MIALGCDVSTKRLAICGIRDDPQRSIVTHALDLDPKARGARRLAAARTIAYGVLGAYTREACVIAVEEPFGRGRGGRELRGIAYVVLEAAQASCPNAAVMDVALGTWRSAVLGDGHAGKTEAFDHAAGLGYLGDDDDLAEALSVAEYAWQRWYDGTRRESA